MSIYEKTFTRQQGIVQFEISYGRELLDRDERTGGAPGAATVKVNYARLKKQAAATKSKSNSKEKEPAGRRRYGRQNQNRRPRLRYTEVRRAVRGGAG
jgi:hypothetical protein